MAKVCERRGGDGSRCIPGCSPRGQQCPDLDRTYSCSFPPSDLRGAMQAQQDRESFRKRNNELVVDLRSIESRLPGAVEGFFVIAGTESGDGKRIVAAYHNFLRTYHLSEEGGPTLLTLDLVHGGNRPFSAARG